MSKETDKLVSELPEKVQAKIAYNIRRIECGTIDDDVFKKLNSNIWEIRTLYYSRCFRLLAFWDTETETLVIVTHGIEKKTQKTPEAGDRNGSRVKNAIFK